MAKFEKKYCMISDLCCVSVYTVQYAMKDESTIYISISIMCQTPVAGVSAVTGLHSKG